ncbi:MAG: M23 family metallopeptidase [bacterium]
MSFAVVLLLPFSPLFSQPLDCTLGQDCFIQNYVDHDPALDHAVDFQCGKLSYDGHKGTDYRLRSMRDVEKGVAVRAAAAGRVLAIRDGEADINVNQRGKENLDGRDCGNGVLIDHGDGWHSQYCHIKKGSVQAQVGQDIAQGTIIGLVGLSGNTEFPHLHFELRHNGQTIDPFASVWGTTLCQKRNPAAPSAPSLWQPNTPTAYQATGLIDAGFTNRAPNLTNLMAGEDRLSSLQDMKEALVFWGQFYGVQQGDQINITLYYQGQIWAQSSDTLKRDKADYMIYAGRKLRPSTRPGMPITGRITLYRPLEKGTRMIVDRQFILPVEGPE